MPTNYSGREDEHDLGDGHSFVWLYAGGDEDRSGAPLGLIEHHPDLSPPVFRDLPGARYPPFCGGYVAWLDDERSGTLARHELVAGAPGDEGRLTIAPSLLCPRCGNHGFIRDGAWVPA